MRINYAKADGFRGFSEPVQFDFGKSNEIVGPNGAGKSSIMEIISFALAGADKYGKQGSTDRLMNKGRTDFSVSVGISVNGVEYEVERQVARLKNKNETRVYVNGSPIVQDQIDSIIGNRDHFLMAFLPKYFLGMSDKEIRTELTPLFPLPKQGEVIELLREDDPDAAELISGCQLTDPDTFISKESEYLKGTKEDLLRLEGKKEEIDAASKVEIPEIIAIDKSGIETTKQMITAIEQAKPKLIDVTKLQQERQRLLLEYQALNKNLVYDEQIIECDNCGHKINLNAEQEKKNEQIVSDMAVLRESGLKVAAEIEIATTANTNAIDEFNKANSEVINDLRSDLATMEVNLRKVEQHNMQVEVLKKNQQAAKDRKQSINDEIKQAKSVIAATEKRIKAAKAYNIKRCELQTAGIDKVLDRVTIRLFEVVKSTGEVKPAFKFQFDEKEVRVLSTSEEIRCFIEISRLIRHLTGKNFPIFIDQAESISDIPPHNVQVFKARFVSDSTLSVIEEESYAGAI